MTRLGEIFVFDTSKITQDEIARLKAATPGSLIRLTNIRISEMKRSTRIVVGKDNLPTFIHLAVDGLMTYVTVASTATGTQEFSMPTQIFEAMRVQFDELTEAIQRGA